MKFKTFDRLSSATMSVKNDVALMSINPRAGLISFSKGFCMKAGLTEKTKVKFLQDEEKPLDWFIQISKDENAFQLRSGGSKGITFNNTAITRELLRSVGAEDNCSHRFLLSTEKIKDGGGDMYAIITKSAKQVKIKDKK